MSLHRPKRAFPFGLALISGTALSTLTGVACASTGLAPLPALRAFMGAHPGVLVPLGSVVSVVSLALMVGYIAGVMDAEHEARRKAAEASPKPEGDAE